MLVGKYVHAEHVKYCIRTKIGAQHSQFLEKLKIQKILHAKKTCFFLVLNHENRSLEDRKHLFWCLSGMFSQKVIVIIVLFVGAPPAAAGRAHLVGAGRDAVLQRARAPSRPSPCIHH